MTTDLIAQAEARLAERYRDERPHFSVRDADLFSALIARIRELEGERDVLEANKNAAHHWRRENLARAAAALAKLAEVEKERQKLEIELATVLAREANSFTRHDAKMQTAEAHIATLTAQVEAMRGADEGEYLIVKRGMYYRPNSQGYTSSPAEAGRYTLAQAVFITHPNGPDGPRDGMSYVTALAAITTENQTNG